MATRAKGTTPPEVLPNGKDKEPQTEDAAIEIEGASVEVEADGQIEQPRTRTEQDPGVTSLQEQLAAAERRAAEAEGRLQAERAERSKDVETIRDSRLAVIEGTITTNETKRDAIKKRIKDAKEAGDYEAETEAVAELTEVTLNLKQAQLGKDRIENEIEEAKSKPAEPTGGDPLDEWARKNNVGARSVAWLRAHPDYMSDPEKNAELQLAEVKARKAGHAPNTDGYFQALEENLGLLEKPEPEVRRSSNGGSGAPAVAPVTRSSGNGGGRQVSPIEGITHLGGDRYRVSPEIAEAAQMSGLTVRQYITEAMKLRRNSDGTLN